MQNVMVASGNGEIGFFVAGLAPIREPGSGWLPASSDAFVPWRGFVPFDELPARFDPPGDLLFNANNHLVGDAYGHDLGRDWDGGFRARRLEALLLGKPRLDTETMRRIQMDIRSNLAADFLPHLLEAISNRAEFREIHELLEDWDLRADADSAAMLVFAAWYDELADVIYADELGRSLPIYRGIRATFTRSILEDAQEWCDDRRTLGREDCSSMLRLALRRALTILRSAHGEDLASWRWGDAHRFRPSHMPFSQIPLISRLFALDRPASGDSTSLNVAHYRAQPSAVFEITQGPGYRGLYDLARPHHAAVVIAGGQSGHPFSKHYDDLVGKWLSGDLVDLAKREPGKRLLLHP
jgi:penicillin amidase